MVINATLCFILRDGQVLLLLKEEGRFGGGKWNGLGGKLKAGESPVDCVTREVLEESGLLISHPKAHGDLYFRFGNDPQRDWSVRVYSATEFQGVPRPSDEGNLKWFGLDEIPYGQMWEDDRHWLPTLLEGGSFHGDFLFDAKGERIVSFQLKKEPPSPAGNGLKVW